MNNRSAGEYSIARRRFSEFGVETEAALQTLAGISLSIPSWQCDDVGGFEQPGGAPGGGLAVTGEHPGRARSADELRSDLDQAFRLIPGTHRLNLHASYAESGGLKVERTDLTIAHFQGWVDWCKERHLGFDFNPTYFAHRLAADGFTLTHQDPQIRAYWIAHGQACRRIAAAAGRQLGSAAITNFWIPDGYKDLTVDRKGPRLRLEASLDAIFAEPMSQAEQLDAVESKLFGIGSEAYVAGSHEFYLGYAVTRQKVLCLDAGHFHPTESVADKISSILQFVPRLLLHLSRGLRWDSDHVVLADDPTRTTMQEIVRGGFLPRTHLGLDFFDASINRIAALVIGARAALRALLDALLEPTAKLRALEMDGDFTSRLALLEELKGLPGGLVWDEHCRRQEVPSGTDWLTAVKSYEERVLLTRC